MTEWTGKPPSEATGAAEAYVVEFLRRTYEERGTMDWSSRTAGWLLVRLMTKLLCVPHGPHSGRTVPEIQQAYLPLVRDLVSTDISSFIHRRDFIPSQGEIPLSCARLTAVPENRFFEMILLLDAFSTQKLTQPNLRSLHKSYLLIPL